MCWTFQISWWQGYSFFLSENYISGTEEKVTVSENRIFQQLFLKQAIGKVSVNHRYRIEERFVGDNFRLRFRYMLGVRVNIIKSGNLNLSFYDEIFLHTDQPVFDRNRLYGGLGFKLNEKLKVEMELIYQFF